jgi:hypothetical protein
MTVAMEASNGPTLRFLVKKLRELFNARGETKCDWCRQVLFCQLLFTKLLALGVGVGSEEKMELELS